MFPWSYSSFHGLNFFLKGAWSPSSPNFTSCLFEIKIAQKKMPNSMFDGLEENLETHVAKFDLLQIFHKSID
jgi:hypothetical protein